MLIDSKGKLFGKISIVDIIVVVMILGVIAGVGYKFTKSRTSTPFSKKDAVMVTFFQEEVPGYVPGTIKVGDIAADNATGSVFGKVVSVKADKAVSVGTNSNGEMVQTSRPGYNSLTVVVEGQGIYKDGASDQGVSFDNTNFFVNKSIELKVGNSITWFKIKSLEKKG